MHISKEPAPVILLIEIDMKIAEKVKTALVPPIGMFEVEQVHQLSEGIERLRRGGIAAILLDLFLPDSQGIATFEKLVFIAPNIPILIVGEDAQEAIAIKAVECGAQDYLLPGHLDAYSLPRALRNAIERKIVEDALYVERERALVTLNSIGDAVLCTDISGQVTYLNLVAERMTGWSREEAIGRPLTEVFQIVDGSTRNVAPNPLKMAVDQDRAVGLAANCLLIRRDGCEAAIEDSSAPIHDRAGSVIGAVVVFHDVSAARAMTLKMTHAAHHDVVTELPNCLLLNDRICQAIVLARLHHRQFAVMMLDLDHFKSVNDSLGHSEGDKLLQSVSKRLIASLRASDTVSRQGGDEFIVLLSEITDPEDAAGTARKLLLSVGTPYLTEDQTVHITSSIGISVFPMDGEDADTLIHHADLAMYHAKVKGRNTFQFFTLEMNLQAKARQVVESGLRRALEKGEFLLHYQPKVNLRTGEITGAEALIRWHEADRGFIPPAEFIPVAEECGLILPMGRWVLREACRQLSLWRRQGIGSLTIAVNISAVEFRDGGLVEEVRSVLTETGLTGKDLQLELTESVLMKSAEFSTSVLKELKRMGVQLAVDDFGTGYSSLSYLRQFPIDVLKIDRSFIEQINTDPDGSILVGAIVAMGRSLGHTVVAEGIETEGQRAFLQAQGCDEGQGYLFSHPLGASEFLHLLGTGEFHGQAFSRNGASMNLIVEPVSRLFEEREGNHAR